MYYFEQFLYVIYDLLYIVMQIVYHRKVFDFREIFLSSLTLTSNMDLPSNNLRTGRGLDYYIRTVLSCFLGSLSHEE